MQGLGPAGIRDAALLLALLDSAARATELLAANGEDVDLHSGALVRRQTKGPATGDVSGTRTRRALLRYLRLRGELAPEASMLATRNRGRLSYWGLPQVLRRRAELLMESWTWIRVLCGNDFRDLPQSS